MTNDEIIEVFRKHKLYLGFLLSASKSAYRKKYPNNQIYFNANIFTQDNGKVWYGDIDLTKHKKKLQVISNEIKQDLYVLRESDGRFGGEFRTFDEFSELAVGVIRGTD